MRLPQDTRYIGDEDPSEFWWIISGELVDFSAGYTFVLRVAPKSDTANATFEKTSGITGAAGSGSQRDDDGVPNVSVEWDTSGELNDLDEGWYVLEIVATDGTGADSTLRQELHMLSRLGPVPGP